VIFSSLGHASRFSEDLHKVILSPPQESHPVGRQDTSYRKLCAQFSCAVIHTIQPVPLPLRKPR
jgi:hypothetical protein